MKKTFYVPVLQIILATMIFSQSYVDLNSPFSSSVRVLYMSNANTLFAGGDIGFFKSTDLGQTWDTLLTENTRSIYIHDDSTCYLCTYGGIYKTTDSGEQWVSFGQSIPSLMIEDIAINLSNNNFFAATILGLYKSTDDGNNWINTLNCTTSGYSNIESINDTLIFLGKSSPTSNYSNLYRSFDNGNNWEIIDVGSFPSRIFKAPKNILFLEKRSPSSAELYKSTNRGVNWYLIFPSYTNDTGFGPWTAGIYNSVIMQYHYWMNVGTYNVRLRVFFNNYQSVTEHQLWATQGDRVITSITSNLNQELFAGLENGEIRKISGISLTESNEEPTSTPNNFALNQNYPNPFNPSTKISWQTPLGGWQTLKVYDILGNEVATLVNEYRNAGSYEVNFDASRLASGVYYYQLKAGEFVETNKMILLK